MKQTQEINDIITVYLHEKDTLDQKILKTKDEITKLNEKLKAHGLDPALVNKIFKNTVKNQKQNPKQITKLKAQIKKVTKK